MATIVIPEQIVFTVKPVGNYPANAFIEANWPEQLPTLLITFNGNKYTVKCIYSSEEDWYYGEEDDNGVPVFTTYPFYIVKNALMGGILKTEEPGEYVISAVVVEEKSPKVLSFPKGRTIVSELSRLNKAFGNVSKKKTIIGQLSDIADAAEAGKIGGGDSMIQVIKKEDINNKPDGIHTMKKEDNAKVYNSDMDTFLPITCVLCEKINIDGDNRILILDKYYDGDISFIVTGWRYVTLPAQDPDSDTGKPINSYLIAKDTPAIKCNNEEFYIINDPDSLVYIDGISPK